MVPNEKHPLGLRLSTVALLLGIFVAGSLTGAGIYHWAAQSRGPRGMPRPGGAMAMQRELGLSDDQAKRVDAIMEKYHPELKAVIRETFPRVLAVHEKIDAEIRPLLNEEQRRRFDELKTRRPDPRHFDGAPPLGAPPLGAPPLGAPPLGAPPLGAPPLGAPPLGAPPLGAPPLGAPPLGAPPLGAPGSHHRPAPSTEADTVPMAPSSTAAAPAPS